MPYTYEELVGMIDHSLLHPTITDADLKAGCIKPYAVKQAVEWLHGAGVRVGCVIGFPLGNCATESKRCETQLACQDEAIEIELGGRGIDGRTGQRSKRLAAVLRHPRWSRST